MAGSAWLDELWLPQPYAGKVTSLRQLTGEFTAEIAMLSEATADLLRADRGYQVIQQLPGIGPVLAAVIIASSATCTGSTMPGSCARGPRDAAAPSPTSRSPAGMSPAGLVAAAVGAGRGDPARPPRLPDRLGQGRHRRPPGQGSQEHRQGRRRRRLLILVFYGLRDGQIRCLSQSPAQPPAPRAGQAA